jgi:hypothetical protein
MIDGTRMALRPDTVFQIDEYDAEPQRESVLLTLFRGGMRAITGFISKRNKSAFRRRSANATIGICGTTFDVRVCGEGSRGGNSCAEDSDRARPIAFARGNVVLEAPGGVARNARAGVRIREGDTVRTGLRAFAVCCSKMAAGSVSRGTRSFALTEFAWTWKRRLAVKRY